LTEENYFLEFPEEMDFFPTEKVFPESKRALYEAIELRRVRLQNAKIHPYFSLEIQHFQKQG
jgi:hypothetical protein